MNTDSLIDDLGENLAIWFAAPGCVEVRPAPTPRPGAGEVLIRSRRSLISTGTELTMLHRTAEDDSSWGEFARFPRMVGYSNVGVVASVGPEVDAGWVGGRVATRGPHARWCVRPIDDLRPIPDELSDDVGTFAMLAGVVMNGLRRAGLTWGESVAVFGLGLVGQLAARVAHAAGAGPIFGVEPSEFRRRLLPGSGRVLAVDGTDARLLIDTIRRRNRGRKVDLAVEATGDARSIPASLGTVREGGRLLLLSSPNGETTLDLHQLCNRPSVSIVGAHGFSQPRVATADQPWTSPRHGELFLDWVAAGPVTVEELITHTFSYADATTAYRLLSERRDETLGVLFDWT